MPEITKKERTVPASSFVATIAANVDNDELSDDDFRQIVRDVLPVVIYDGCEEEQSEEE